ncbi:ribonuclease J [Companilactobacillus sp. RD055328]|uniref:ribonuclease J n=1 Tax=Companilactobacillus sp. RD055328 TaxID=2916634 RepID=UPI001FC8CB6D|nr:ribonuclease J [Companilactobacillus sp. RD055328]GKQ42809.1 ribonuclease J [Companilactobacillus sp. RD055328]
MDNIKIVLLGGVRENGKNMYAIEVGDEIFILDAGLKYPDNELLGIDVVVPDLTYVEENIDKIVGIFVTHGHIDAIGAIPYIVANHDIPVFGSKLTIALAKITTQSDKKSRNFNDFHEIDENTAIDFSNASVSFFKTTHSIPGSLGISVKTSEGQIVYTGDFKFDQAAIPMYRTDFGRIADIGKEKVLALLSDSANAESLHENSSEREIYEYILDTFKYHEGRIVVASVASNIQRMQQIIDASSLLNRKVAIAGKDAEKIVRTAMQLGYLKIPEGVLISEKELKDHQPEETVLVETGRMGEPIKLLQRMANAKRGPFKIMEGDLVFIATTPTHAMETIVAKTRDMIYRANAEVKTVSDGLFPSGHANKNDLQLMINLLHPENVIPIQGEYRLMDNHGELAHETGIATDHIFMTQKGDVLEYDGKEFNRGTAVEAGDTMIDGIGVGDIGSIVLRDRQMLAEDGVFVAVVTIDRKKKKIVSRPKVNARGFVYMRDNKELLNESIDVITKAIEDNLENKEFDWANLKREVRDNLNKYLFEQTRRRPMILPVIMEVNQNRHRARR